MHSDVGALLVEGGVISEQQLQHALTTAVQYGGTLIQNLIRLEYLGDEELASFLSSKLKSPSLSFALIVLATSCAAALSPTSLEVLLPSWAMNTHQGFPLPLIFCLTVTPIQITSFPLE